MQPQYRIVLIYILMGALWIFFSDTGTEVFLEKREDIIFVQKIKGWFFIALTGALLFILIRRAVEEKSKINTQLIEGYDQTICGWVNVMDLRHKETKDHTGRVTLMTLALAKYMGIENKQQLKDIERGAILHDIGKIGIPDAVLLKPGPLDDAEMAVIRTHTQIAYNILINIDFLRPCIDIPYSHHEKWNGTGYPKGLKGEEIPLAARIFAVVDVWDALIHPRVYKNAWPEERVMNYIQEESGQHFDPSVVQVFIEHYDLIKQAALSEVVLASHSRLGATGQGIP